MTLLRDSAHEWYITCEKKHRQMPKDWAQLSTALLERFGSNIRSQEAQSQLMSISQGMRPVREYASQFETLLGRLDFVVWCSSDLGMARSELDLLYSIMGCI